MFPGSPPLNELSNGQERWPTFRKTLRPHYGIVWRDVALCFAMLSLGMFVHALLAERLAFTGAIVATAFVGVWSGYWLHALMLFGHEAAHGNIAPHGNDLIADWTVWLPFALTTARYRSTHWEHHLHLGDHDDTEHSYRNCMQSTFLLKLVTGVYLLTMLKDYQGGAKGGERSQSADAIQGAAVRTIFFHAGMVAACLRAGAPATAIAWLLGIFVFFPFFATVRQVLEHREAEATCARDFTLEEHGPINRLFGTDLFSRYFGAAGFNRHLLHHWDPTVSYTRFDDMERFFLHTPLGSQMKIAQSTYGKTFVDMLRSASHG